MHERTSDWGRTDTFSAIWHVADGAYVSIGENAWLALLLVCSGGWNRMKTYPKYKKLVHVSPCSHFRGTFSCVPRPAGGDIFLFGGQHGPRNWGNLTIQCLDSTDRLCVSILYSQNIWLCMVVPPQHNVNRLVPLVLGGILTLNLGNYSMKKYPW